MYKGENEGDEEFIPSTDEVINELSKSEYHEQRELTSQELSRFGFDSMEDVKKFSAEIKIESYLGYEIISSFRKCIQTGKCRN